ncbi:MAG: Rieske 2Fe-2S domain-containing protein [candidate division NC10 bacterium]|nr:Rieske 2Fe-2S domain-containing protein [candidate division NC10 bacterium]
MARKIKVAQVSDVAPGEGKIVQADGEQIALFNVGGRFYAIHNTCLHRGGPLGEGALDEATVTCPWHGWQYDVTSGTNVRNPAANVASFNVKVEGADVLVELP